MIQGTINFGIGTQTDNALSGVTAFALDACGDLPQASFGGVAYSDTFCNNTGNSFGAFFDTGSNGLYVLDANTLSSLGISDCSSSSSAPGFYCVTAGGTTTLSPISLLGSGNVGSGTVSLNIKDAISLFNTGNSVFNDVGGDSVPGGSASTDFFDFGSPFFFGRTVFIGIGGEAVPTGVIATTGFVAF